MSGKLELPPALRFTLATWLVFSYRIWAALLKDIVCYLILTAEVLFRGMNFAR
jgi:hypothetical protein